MYYDFENLNYKTLLLEATGKVLKKLEKAKICINPN